MINEKLTLDDLSSHIMLKHNMTKEDAGRFLTNFLKVVIEGLISDRYVRIKGIGTFKFIEENVDANHTSGKIVFVPESALKDAVNKPFSHFESIVLNENVHFDDVEELILSNNSASEAEENICSDIIETDKEVGNEDENCLLYNTDDDTEKPDINDNKIDVVNEDKILKVTKDNLDNNIKLENKLSITSHSHNIRWYIILAFFYRIPVGNFCFVAAI